MSLSNSILICFALLGFPGGTMKAQNVSTMTLPPIKEDLESLRTRAKGGDPKAMYQLVRQYPEAYDDTQRVHWMWKSADLGYGPAMMRLAAEATPAVVAATTQRLGSKVGSEGLTRRGRITEAFEHLLVWARKGDAESMCILGSSFWTFAEFRLETHPEAIQWLRAAARAGHPSAPFELAATLFEDGLSLKDRQEGFELLKKLGSQGDCIALHLICQAYDVGRPKAGIRRDREQLDVWVDILGRHCGAEAAIYPPYFKDHVEQPGRKGSTPQRKAKATTDKTS